MSGWVVAAVIVGLVTVATIGLNLSIWLSHRAVAAARGDWTVVDFIAAMTALHFAPTTAVAVNGELSSYYMAGLAPRPDDELDALLRIDPDELMDIVERLIERLGLPLPEGTVTVPTLTTVADLAVYIDRYPVKS